MHKEIDMSKKRLPCQREWQNRGSDADSGRPLPRRDGT